RRADRQWLFGPDRYIYNYLHYDAANQSLQRLQVFELDPATYQITGRLVAQRATYVGDGEWYFEDGWSRSFENGEPIHFERFPEKRLVHFPEGPEYFETEIRPPEQMGYVELAEYIDQVKRSGQLVPELEVQLQSKIAYPAISLVMALVALPFAFRLGRQGALYGVGLSIVLGMVFLAIYAFFTTLGEAGALPPVVAVWSPNVVFSMTALYLFLGIRT
ncbi:MAG: LptF/LptG family permease, partial [Acidobacteriota bacterium]